MNRTGYTEMGIPATIITVVLVVALYNGWDAFPLWLRILMIAGAALFALVAVVSMATPSWPNMTLEEAAAAEPVDAAEEAQPEDATGAGERDV